jgi:hypothetical protein
MQEDLNGPNSTEVGTLISIHLAKDALAEAQPVIEPWTTTRTAICRVRGAGSVANLRRG